MAKIQSQRRAAQDPGTLSNLYWLEQGSEGGQ